MFKRLPKISSNISGYVFQIYCMVGTALITDIGDIVVVIKLFTGAF